MFGVSSGEKAASAADNKVNVVGATQGSVSAQPMPTNSGAPSKRTRDEESEIVTCSDCKATRLQLDTTECRSCQAHLCHRCGSRRSCTCLSCFKGQLFKPEKHEEDEAQVVRAYLRSGISPTCADAVDKKFTFEAPILTVPNCEACQKSCPTAYCASCGALNVKFTPRHTHMQILSSKEYHLFRAGWHSGQSALLGDDVV